MSEKLGFRLKWLAVSSFEMEFGSTTVVSDPYITHCKGTDLTWEAVEKCNIITLSHAHWDHITDIPALMEKFNPRMLCGDQTMTPMAEWLNCKISRIYPMYPDTELDFGDVKVRALYGRHTELKSGYNRLTRYLENHDVAELVRDFPDDPNLPTMGPLQGIGSLEYRNYLFTLPNGVKILLWGGYPTREQFALYSKLKPDVAIIQRSTDPKDIARKARFAAELGAKIVIPHHHDFREVDPPEVAAALDLFEKEYLTLVPDGRFIKPVHGEWIEL